MRIRAVLTLLLALAGIALMPTAGRAAERHIYWADSQGDAIGQAGIDGTDIDDSFITDFTAFPTGLAANADHLYWGNQNSNSVARADADGSNRGYVVNIASSVHGVALDATDLYWTEDLQAIAAGTLPDALDPHGLWTVDDQIFQLAVDDTYIYWSSAGGHAIGRARLDGSGVADPEFVTGIGQSGGIAVDDDYIYYGDIDAPAIGRVPKGGGTPEQSFIPADSAPFGLAIDDEYIYWPNSISQSIGRAKIDGTDVDQTFVSPIAGGFIQGIAVTPRQPVFSVSPAAHSFGDTVVGNRSTSQSFSIRNDGDAPLDVSGVSLTGANANEFALTANECTVAVAPAGTCTVGVEFRPTVAGAAGAELQFTHNGAGSPSSVALTGTGVAPSGSTPVISKLTASPRKPRKPVNNLTFRFELSQAAKVSLRIERKYGRQHRTACKRTTPASRLKKRCPIYRHVTTRTSDGSKGANSMRFDASKMHPGLYRATATASNSNGTSNAARVNFYRPWW